MKKFVCILFFLISVSALFGCNRQKENELPAYSDIEIEASGEPQAKEEVLKGARIEEQTFEVTLNPLGEVTFASYEPDDSDDPLADVVFLIEKGGNMLLQLPGMRGEMFDRVEAVSFLDYNNDGYDDIVVIVSYYLGAGPQAAMPHSTIRYYTGSAQGEFIYEEELSLEAETEISEMSIPIHAAIDFVKEHFGQGERTVIDTYEGKYNDVDTNEPNLIIRKNEDETYSIEIGIFRLAYMDDGIGRVTDKGMEFSITVPNGKTASGIITREEEAAVVKFTDGWSDFSEVEEFRYYISKISGR